MFPTKGGDAYSSGMRGPEKPRQEADAFGKHDEKEQSTGDDSGLAGIVAQHVHGPDENGHHHLNLTTFSEHLKSGKHPGR